MSPRDFSFFSQEIAQFVCKPLSEGWRQGELVSVRQSGEDYVLRQGDATGRGRLLSDQGLRPRLARNDSRLWLLLERRGEHLRLRSLDLMEETRADPTISVGAEIAAQLAGANEISAPEISAAIDWLTRRFLLQEAASGLRRLLFERHATNGSGTSFRLLGAGWAAAIAAEETRFRLTGVERLTKPRGPVAAVVGEVAFRDAEALSSAPDHSLRLGLPSQKGGGLVRFWLRRDALEWGEARRRAKRLAPLAFSRREAPHGTRGARRWLLVAEAKAMNAFMRQWKRFGASEATRFACAAQKPDFGAWDAESWRRTASGLVKFRKDGLLFSIPEHEESPDPPSSGFMFWDLRGAALLKAHRTQVWTSLLKPSQPTRLNRLLEGSAPPSAPRRRVSGASRASLSCFQGAEPTPQQLEALEVAVNTPDVALLLGPPGTGKTQVVTALRRRFAELSGEEGFQSQILFDRPRRDLPDDGLTRLRVFGLPSARAGLDARDQTPAARWRFAKAREIEDRIQRLREASPMAELFAAFKRRSLRLKFARLSSSERREGFEELDALALRMTAEGLRLPGAAAEAWTSFIEAQRLEAAHPLADREARMIRVTKALRVDALGFSDDGPERIRIFMRESRRFSRSFDDEENDLLFRLGALAPGQESDADRAELQRFKENQLRKLLDAQNPRRALTQDELQAVADLEDEAEATLRRSRHGASLALGAYQAALIHDPEGVARAIQTYAGALGSMGAALGADEAYDTAIVDEAAQADPLDLLAAMMKARRRILLVGDLGQAPFRLQQSLESEEEKEDAPHWAPLPHMLRLLRAQERRDGIRRVVTLDDVQHRMHPTLNAFVHDNFRAKQAATPISSNLSAPHFAHGAPGYERLCAAWLNAPAQLGAEERWRGGRRRPAEATLIAQEVERLAKACGPKLSIGALSLYEAQRDCIFEAFARRGLAERRRGAWSVAPDYALTTRGEERLRVGTIDDVQGAEFDVVFLSLVRADLRAIPENLDAEGRRRRLREKYGLLGQMNRMSLAMSRQRRLLVVVGERGMGEGRDAQDGAPALAAFHKLCRAERERRHEE